MQQLETTPWPAVLELLNYWKKWPPPHVLVKKGFFQEAEKPRTITDPEELASLIKGI